VDQKARRAAVTKAFRAKKVALRKGHWRIAGPEITWYVDLRADGPSPAAAMRFEVGAWAVELGPEPDGGAVDCALLVDVPLEGEPGAAATALADRLLAVTTVEELAAARARGDFAGAFVDADLRDLMGER
jgi:hypothetical protein